MNQEKEQNRAYDTYAHFEKFGYVMFKQNKRTYENIAEHKQEGTVLEAGCGMGLGAYLINADMATDKLSINVKFAKEVYPKINFAVWNIAEYPFEKQYDVVVCVETIEHVADLERAIKNLVASAKKEVWISTPNNKEETPSNPYHVEEKTVEEMYEFLEPYGKVEMFHWDTFAPLDATTKVSPIIYRITL